MAPTKPKRRRFNDPQAMRRRVLDVAAIAFHCRGYHSTSTHDIMRDAGVTGGALHHHFPTKKSIGLAVIRERVAEGVKGTWIAPVRSAPTALEGILDAFDNVVAAIDKRGSVWGCPLNNLALELSLADPEFRSEIQNLFSDWRAVIAEKLQADKAAGILKDVDTEDLATFVVASYSGAMAIAKSNQSSEPLKRCARQLAALVQPGWQRARSPSRGSIIRRSQRRV